jgi:haloacetate dehalogenase
MWHKVAPLLLDKFQVICPDLRGYGRSDKPVSDELHKTYSKRVMANDCVALMKQLGHDTFDLVGHDRGARVAHRLGIDHSERVKSMVLLDIAPTREMYANTGAEFAHAYWHWFFLTQKHPIPEKMIGQDSDSYWKLKCYNQAGYNSAFSEEALQEYLEAFRSDGAIHASCEDYRAAATIDIVHDNEDGNRKLALPLHVIWAQKGAIEKCFDAMALWRQRTDNVSGEKVDATHYMAEEIPETISQKIIDFCTNQAMENSCG